VPRVQRTVRNNGYATYSFRAPAGRRIVSSSVRIVGGSAHAVRVRHRSLSPDRTRLTVNLIFPGEQGKPGRLVVRLASIA
jgi:hypothetical protein